MHNQQSPHDAVFRKILGKPPNAASQLRAVLPPALTARLDLDHLAQVSGSLVDTDLRWRHSDLLFTAPLDDHDAYIYVLIEHQSSQDPLMPFRMLHYLVRIWDHLPDDLPPWEDDLLAIADSPGGRDVLVALVTYIGTVSDTPEHELRQFFTRLGPAAEEAYMTTADMLRAEGEVQGQTRTLLRLLTLKFGPLPQAVRDAVHSATPEQLQTWTDRILTANTLDEVIH